MNARSTTPRKTGDIGRGGSGSARLATALTPLFTATGGIHRAKREALPTGRIRPRSYHPVLSSSPFFVPARYRPILQQQSAIRPIQDRS